jgi:hypothetical protein
MGVSNYIVLIGIKKIIQFSKWRLKSPLEKQFGLQTLRVIKTKQFSGCPPEGGKPENTLSVEPPPSWRVIQLPNNFLVASRRDFNQTNDNCHQNNDLPKPIQR